MTDLIKIEEREGQQTVNARELWEKLESKQQFADWIKNRLEGFADGTDFILHNFMKVQTEGQREVSRPVIDYYLTIDTAKHIAMLERNDKGRFIRQYFIQIENSWNTPEMAMARGLQAANKLIEGLKHENQLLERKAAVADRLVETVDEKPISCIGKIGGFGPRKLIWRLIEDKILYRETVMDESPAVPYQPYIERGYFVVRYAMFTDRNGKEHRKPQTYITGKGEAWITDRYLRQEARQVQA